MLLSVMLLSPHKAHYPKKPLGLSEVPSPERIFVTGARQ
jgi:hypothetical protein